MLADNDTPTEHCKLLEKLWCYGELVLVLFLFILTLNCVRSPVYTKVEYQSEPKCIHHSSSTVSTHGLSYFISNTHPVLFNL